MGEYHTLYLGAGVKIPRQYFLQKTIERSCGNHQNNPANKYCPKCGKEIKNIEVQRKSISLPEELIGNDRLRAFFDDTESETIYLLSSAGHGIVKGVDSNCMIKIDTALIEEKKEEFRLHHLTDISHLEESIKHKIEIDFFFFDEYG